MTAVTEQLPLATAREGSIGHWAAITWLLAKRTFRLRYLGSRLGLGWAFLQPLVQAAVLSFLFTKVFSGFNRPPHFPLYMLTGVMVWQCFAGGVNGATTSAVDNASLLRKIPMPAIVFPLSQVVSVLMVFALQMVILIAGSIVFGTESIKLLLLPLVPLLCGAIATGIGCFTCAFHPAVRDVKFVVESGLLMAFYATPVIYDPTRLHSDTLRSLLALNPMYGVVSLARTALMDRPFDGEATLISLGAGLVFVVIGLLVFQRRSATFADLA